MMMKMGWVWKNKPYFHIKMPLNWTGLFNIAINWACWPLKNLKKYCTSKLHFQAILNFINCSQTTAIAIRKTAPSNWTKSKVKTCLLNLLLPRRTSCTASKTSLRGTCASLWVCSTTWPCWAPPSPFRSSCVLPCVWRTMIRPGDISFLPFSLCRGLSRLFRPPLGSGKEL